MKSFKARPLFWLCLPSVFLLGVGFFLSRRMSGVSVRPALEFHLEPPTVFEAFSGADVVAVVNPINRGERENDWHTPSFSIQTAKIPLTSACGDDNGRLQDAWIIDWAADCNASRFVLKTRHLPPGEMRFADKVELSHYNGGDISLWGSPTYIAPIQVTGHWAVERAKISTFDFSKIERLPKVSLQNIEVVRVASDDVQAHLTFALREPTQDKVTWRIRFWGDPPASSTLVSQKPGEITTCLYLNPSSTRGKLAHIDGLFNIENRWPLEFILAPFDPSRLRGGEKLAFTQRSATLPAP